MWPGSCADSAGIFGVLVAAGSEHHVPGPPAALGCGHVEAAAFRGRDTRDIRTRPDRSVDALRIVPEMADEVIPQHECFRGGAVIRHAGQREREVRRVQAKRVPPVLPRPAKRFAPFQQLMFDAGPAEPVARGQASLPGPDDKGVDALRSRMSGGRRGLHGSSPVAKVQGWLCWQDMPAASLRTGARRRRGAQAWCSSRVFWFRADPYLLSYGHGQATVL